METTTIELMALQRSRGKGIPCLWERGGGYSNTGAATVIANPSGLPKRPLYIRRSGSLACAEHALIPIRPGDLVVRASHHRYDYHIRVFRIEKIREDADEVELVLINEFDQGEWTEDYFPEAAVDAAKRKAACYHCRGPFFVAHDK